MSSTPEASNNRPNLLIVDDEEGPRQSVKIIFKEDYNTFLASDGESALKILKEHTINVAILDILMADMSGIDLLEKIKKVDPSIEVIMLTAYETLDTARQAIRLGACDYLNKPFDIPTMRTAVARALEKHRATQKNSTTDAQLEKLQGQIQNQQLKEEMMRTKGEIYASVLHDLNSPLTVISGFIEMINFSIENAAKLEGEKLENVKVDLHKLNAQVNRCFEISRRYLSFLRDAPEEISSVSINQIMIDLRDLLLRHPSTQGNTLAIHDLCEEITAEINGTDLLQILLNLTLNALQATHLPHRVEVRCEKLNQSMDFERVLGQGNQRIINGDAFLNRPPLVVISVEDSGPGIPQDIMAKLFETQFTTKEAGKGTGLGLSIVKRLITKAQGAIHLRSEVGQGSSFTVYLQAS